MYFFNNTLNELLQGRGGVRCGVGFRVGVGSYCFAVGARVRLDDTEQAAGPDTGKLTCYCPCAFKHRLVKSRR